MHGLLARKGISQSKEDVAGEEGEVGFGNVFP